ncbi:MAG: pyridoxamine 5'-phosphate oxidase family protein [Deltaproteobacteria bacterium]|nr:pyridoxamine 5'-phosphate oxidase family protein [Deltaproteobacteria bacterium]
MNLAQYFEAAEGLGILATADAEGKPNAAIYAKPHVIDEETVALIMADRKSLANVRTNPCAYYLFKESGDGFKGKRLVLKRVREEQDKTLIESMRRKPQASSSFMRDGETRVLVYFNVVRIIPLIGGLSEP